MRTELPAPVHVGGAPEPLHPNPGGGYAGNPAYNGIMPLDGDIVLRANASILWVDATGHVACAINNSDPFGCQVYADLHTKGGVMSLNGQMHWLANRDDIPERRNWSAVQDADGEAGGLTFCVTGGPKGFANAPVMTLTRDKNLVLHGALTVERLNVKDVDLFSGTIPAGASLQVKDGLIIGFVL